MRTGLLGLVCLLAVAPPCAAALPIRKPDAEAAVEKVVPATDAERDRGVVVTVFLEGRPAGVPVTAKTPVHLQMGKLVPRVAAGDIRPGQKLSVWIDKAGNAEGVLIFP